MIECISTAVEAVKDLSAKVLDGRFLNDICPDFLKSTNEVPAYQIEAAAHSACRFFDMPDAPLIEGDSIGVYTLNPDYLDDDVFQYNIPQFKDMNLYSFEDQTKVWTHECGHRILQKMYGNSWASELGSDFFVGVREEMLGMGSSNFEKTLGATKASHSHPGGKLRIEAIKYGREVAAEMKKNDGEIERLEKKLSNEGFVAKAPAAVIDGERAKLKKYLETRESLAIALAKLN